MFDKLEAVESRFLEIEHKLGDPSLAERPDEFRRLSKEHASLQEVVAEFRNYRKLKNEISSNRELLVEGDAEFSAMAKEELKTLEPELEASTKRLQVLLLPQDPNDQKNILLEIRAGAGGEEAALFAGELYRLYQKFSERQGWRTEVMSVSQAEKGGLKEVIMMIEGQKVFSRLKFEAGVHRVQRVPETEAQGRVHTSTVTVAVLPEAEEVDININPADLRIDVFRSSGAGGQSVNTTDSAVRITHLPSGVVVACQDERSQLKNKEKAMKILRSRILEAEQEKAAKEHADSRRAMVGTGDRSERIRTYNFPQGRLTDHRIGFTLYQLGDVMEGHVDQLLDALQTHYQAEALKQAGYASA
ncbi:MAG: peptide chain release factor 1 [Bdellovibrionales bacterium]|nr:peptide chain release factor 1 [Bdellovibrionales bacterium]